MTTTILSYGGGLDSFAMLLDALERSERPDWCVFADVTDPARRDPGEWPGTYRHVREVAMPVCERAGVRFAWLDTDRYPVRGGRSLFGYFERTQSLPGRQSRLCTSAAKVERIRDWIGDTFGGEPVEVWIGFEAGEEGRAERDPHSRAHARAGARRVNRFPLIERGLCRCRCEQLVRRLGYPVPRKSACVFCPFSSRGDFQVLRRELPGEFGRVAGLEAAAKRTRSGKRMTYGYRRGDETDPSLADWIAPPYEPRRLVCRVCGGERASKAVGCGYQPAEPRQGALW